MLSQVKRKQNLLLTLTLTVLITGSILAFSIQVAYSGENHNSSRSNTHTAIAQVQDELNKLKSDARISGDANMISSIDNMVMRLDEAKKGLDEMGKFFSAVNVELQSLKQTAESIRQTTESTTKESARITATPERIDIAEGVVVMDGDSKEPAYETLFHDSWLIVVPKSMLGDTISDKLIEYLKVTLSDDRIASIVENERTASSKSLTQDEFELTKSTGSVAPGLQPEVIKPKVPEWVRNNAGWYAEGLIPESDFVTGLEWMINNGIIQIAAPVGIGEEGVS